MDNALTIEVLADLIPAAWTAVTGKDELPDPGELPKLLFREELDVPPRAIDLLQVEIRSDGPVLANYTELIGSSQQVGMVRRHNPETKDGETRLTRVQAKNRLASLSFDYPAEVAWLREAFTAARKQPAL